MELNVSHSNNLRLFLRVLRVSVVFSSVMAKLASLLLALASWDDILMINRRLMPP